MSTREKLLETIYQAIDDVNELALADQVLEKKPETVIFGPEGGLDSINLVRFIVAAEEQINEAFGTDLSLTDERAFLRKKSPFRTVDAFASFVLDLLDGTTSD